MIEDLIVALASDHAGVALKADLIDYLQSKNITCVDLGTNSNESVDYPDYAQKLCQLIHHKKATKGVLICGTGIGVSIAANRHPAIRAALCFNEEMAELARKHNDANILALGGRFIEKDLARKMLDKFLQTCFDKGRHEKRIEKIDLLKLI